MDTMHQCDKCGSSNTVFRPRPDTIHHGELRCLDCKCFAWIAKPDTDATKYRREAKHSDLVKKFSNGCCEMCRRSVDELPEKQVLAAHHVVEYQDGGSSERDNIWIVCNACHRLITWVRKYHGSSQILESEK
jgi:5-methylcytosine-specific restriction endonuclease McrA